MTSLSCSAALDDSLEFSYGQKGVDKNDYENLLENEKKNFKLLISKVKGDDSVIVYNELIQAVSLLLIGVPLYM